MHIYRAFLLSLLLFCIMACSGCGLTYRGMTAAAQSVNMKRVTVEYGVTTPEDVVSAIGEPDDEGSYSGKPASYYLGYKTLFAWRGIEVTWCIDGRCRTYDYSHGGVGGSGRVSFAFENGKAVLNKALVPEYQRKR